MTCPFYSRNKGVHHCYSQGILDGHKAFEECMGNFRDCLQNMRKNQIAEKRVYSQEENSDQEVPLIENMLVNFVEDYLN